MPVCDRHMCYVQPNESCIYCSAPDLKKYVSKARRERIAAIRDWCDDHGFSCWQREESDADLEYADKQPSAVLWHNALGPRPKMLI
jgi:hypothetical protein